MEGGLERGIRETESNFSRRNIWKVRVIQEGH